MGLPLSSLDWSASKAGLVSLPLTTLQPRRTIAAAEHIAVEDAETHRVSDTVAYLLASAVYFADLIFLGAAFWLLTEPPGMEELWSRSAKWLGMEGMSRPGAPIPEVVWWKAVLVRPLAILMLFALTLVPIALIIASIALTLDLLGR